MARMRAESPTLKDNPGRMLRFGDLARGFGRRTGSAKPFEVGFWLGEGVAGEVADAIGS
jgi:hypothetical protein